MVRSAMLRRPIKTVSNLGAGYDSLVQLPSRWNVSIIDGPTVLVGHLSQRLTTANGQPNGIRDIHYVSVLPPSPAAASTPGGTSSSQAQSSKDQDGEAERMQNKRARGRVDGQAPRKQPPTGRHFASEQLPSNAEIKGTKERMEERAGKGPQIFSFGGRLNVEQSRDEARAEAARATREASGPNKHGFAGGASHFDAGRRLGSGTAAAAAGTDAASTDPSQEFFPEELDEEPLDEDDGFGMDKDNGFGDEDPNEDEAGGDAVRLASHRNNSKCPPRRAREIKFKMLQAPWCYQFKCWFMAAGMSEKECMHGYGHKGTTFGEKMRHYLHKYPGIGVVPDGDVAPGFSPITLETVDSDDTTASNTTLRGLYKRVHGAFGDDYKAMQRGKQLPMESQPKEPFAFFPDWIRGWNQSRGWCSAEGCGKALEQHVQTVPAHSRLHRYEDVPVDNSKDNAWSLQRELNHIAHVPSNLIGVICFECQGETNFNHLAHSSAEHAGHPRLDAPDIEVDATTPARLMQSLIVDAKQRYPALGGPEAAAAELQAPPPSYSTKTRQEYAKENKEREAANLPPRWKMRGWRKTDGEPPEYTEDNPAPRCNRWASRRQAAANTINENGQRPRRSQASAKTARDVGSQETEDEPPPRKRRKRNAAKPVSPKEKTVEAFAASLGLPTVGDRVQVWHRDDQWYFGSVLAINCFVSVFGKRALMHLIKYEFDQKEVLHDLRREYWRKPKTSRTVDGPISLARVKRDLGLTRGPPADELNDGRSEGYLSSVDMSVSDASVSESELESGEPESVDSDAVSAVSDESVD